MQDSRLFTFRPTEFQNSTHGMLKNSEYSFFSQVNRLQRTTHLFVFIFFTLDNSSTTFFSGSAARGNAVAVLGCAEHSIDIL